MGNKGSPAISLTRLERIVRPRHRGRNPGEGCRRTELWQGSLHQTRDLQGRGGQGSHTCACLLDHLLGPYLRGEMLTAGGRATGKGSALVPCAQGPMAIPPGSRHASWAPGRAPREARPPERDTTSLRLSTDLAPPGES